MNITMIVPYFRPEITAIVHLMDDLARDLGKYGAQVSVITGYPFRGTSQAVRVQYRNKPVEQINENVRISRVGGKREEGGSFFVRGINYIFKTYAFYRAASEIPADVYFIYSTPPLMGLIGARLSKKAPTVYCLQDIFPDNLKAQGKLKDNGVLYRILQRMEGFIYRNNSHIVTISADMKKNLNGKGVDEDKVSLIGNWIDTDEIRYITRSANQLFDKFALDRNAFYVSYCGNLGYAQDLDILLESAKITQTQAPEIQYIVVGNGACESEFKTKMAKEGIGNVEVFPLQPEEYAASVYSLGDVGLVTLKEGMQGNSMPSKIWSMMSASQPVICTAAENTQLFEIISGMKAGVVIRPGDHQELAVQIISLYHDRNKLRTLGTNGRTYAEMNLTREKATKRYFALIKELAERGVERNVQR
jgi:glycosyltransferase involved in cell wall biosynthesis